MPLRMVIWICCSGLDLKTLHVLGMRRYADGPLRMVIWMCCSGLDLKTVHVLGMRGYA